MKRLILCLLAMLAVIIFTACESKFPLYKALKKEKVYNLTLDDVINSYYIPDADINKDYGGSKGYRKLDETESDKIETAIDLFIDYQYNLRYTNVDEKDFNYLFELMTPQLAVKFEQAGSLTKLTGDIEKYHGIISILYANITPGGYVEVFEDNNHGTVYKAYAELTLRIWADEGFFSEHPAFEKGSATVVLWLFFDVLNIESIKLAKYAETIIGLNRTETILY